MRSEFRVHMLTEEGKFKAGKIADAFATCLDTLEQLCGTDGREMAIVRTKMEEASFFAKKAMAQTNAVDPVDLVAVGGLGTVAPVFPKVADAAAPVVVPPPAPMVPTVASVRGLVGGASPPNVPVVAESPETCAACGRAYGKGHDDDNCPGAR